MLMARRHEILTEGRSAAMHSRQNLNTVISHEVPCMGRAEKAEANTGSTSYWVSTHFSHQGDVALFGTCSIHIEMGLNPS